MATLQDLKDAIAKKDTEVKTKITNLETQLARAESSITGPTPAELDEIKTGIEGIGVSPVAPVVPSPASNQAA